MCVALSDWWNEMRWCCPGFETLVPQGGEPGISLVVSAGEVGVMFVIQQRGTHERPLPSGALAEDVPIQFCPFCGRKLARFYKKTAAQISRPDLRRPL